MVIIAKSEFTKKEGKQSLYESTIQDYNSTYNFPIKTEYH